MNMRGVFAKNTSLFFAKKIPNVAIEGKFCFIGMNMAIGKNYFGRTQKLFWANT